MTVGVGAGSVEVPFPKTGSTGEGAAWREDGYCMELSGEETCETWLKGKKGDLNNEFYFVHRGEILCLKVSSLQINSS